jgi:hypothetical protein
MYATNTATTTITTKIPIAQKYGDYRHSLSNVNSTNNTTPINIPVTFTTNINQPITNQILSPKYIPNKPTLIKSSKYIVNKT